MSYDTVRNGIVALIKSLGYQESNTAFDFEDAPSTEYGNTFIITARSGKLEEVSAETLVDRIYDEQEWEIHIAYQRSSANDLINLNQINRKREELINELDNSTNWKSFVRVLKYNSWEIKEENSYMVLILKLTIIDTLIFT